MTGEGAHARAGRLAGPLLALASAALTVLAIEVACRLLDFDFEFKRRAFTRVPIFYRQPVVPVGPAFYRRPGPDRWEGQVIAPWRRWNGCLDDAQRDEPALSIAYDRLGFRNPPDLADWEIVVVGDSFTELGTMPDEDLFTTRLGALLHRRVKKLGVGGTGTYTHAVYLRQYGKAPGTRDAVLVFFEGNDFLDIVEEHRRLEERAQGIRRLRLEHLPSRLAALPNQSSFVTALHRWATREPPAGVVDCTNAYFTWSGTRTPVTLERIMPPDGYPFRPPSGSAPPTRWAPGGPQRRASASVPGSPSCRASAASSTATSSRRERGPCRGCRRASPTSSASSPRGPASDSSTSPPRCARRPPRGDFRSRPGTRT